MIESASTIKLCLVYVVKSAVLLHVISVYGHNARQEKATLEVLKRWTHGKSNDENRTVPDGFEILIESRFGNHFLALKRNLHLNGRVPILTSRKLSLGMRKIYVGNKSAFYQSAKDHASLALKWLDHGQEVFTGSFESSEFMYTLEPITGSAPRGTTRYLISRTSYPTHRRASHIERKGSYTTFLNDTRKRIKRQKQLYEIELCLVTDFSVYTRMPPISEPEVDTIQDLIDRYTLLVNGIDARFRNIQHQSGYVIHVTLAGIYITETNRTSPWSGAVKSRLWSRDILTEESLDMFSDWLKSNGTWHLFDHVMGITACNIAFKGNGKTLGLGYKQSMCTNRSISIIEDHGNLAYVTYIATHELAHSLGARHDGEPEVVKYNGTTRTCYADDRYIMSPMASSDPSASESLRRWMFSQCSWLYFEFYIKHIDINRINCLIKKNSLASPFINNAHASSEVYSPDVQCTHAHGAASVMSREEININPRAICVSIPCTAPGEIAVTIATLAMEGTKCGTHHACASGVCQETVWNTKDNVEGMCVFGNQPGIVTESKKTCDDLIPSQSSAHLCYNYNSICCRTCANYHRKYTSLPECAYGDRVEGCDVTKCGNDACCETCGLLAGNISSCPELKSPEHGNVTTNTESYHHGSVASFSCQPGHHVNGHVTMICLKNGSWSGDSPTCRKGCPTLTVTSHVVMEDKGDYSIGVVVNFTCGNGLELIGSASLICQSNTEWNGSVPKCQLGFSSTTHIFVPENIKPGTTVHRLSTGTTSVIFKLITYSHPGFEVAENGDVIVIGDNVIDFETVEEYYLNIQAVSAIDKRMVATQTLVISVEDINEFNPEFDKDIYCLAVNGNTSIDFPLLRLQASDGDGSGYITYKRLHDRDISLLHQNLIDIDEQNGEIKLLKGSTYFTDPPLPPLEVVVMAVDSGYPWQRTGSATLNILFEDECAAENNIANQIYHCIFLVILSIVTSMFYFYLLLM